MRTTLSIDDDVLAAARALARQERRNVGVVISELACRPLHRLLEAGERSGIPLLSPRPDTPPVTLEVVSALRDEAT